MSGPAIGSSRRRSLDQEHPSGATTKLPAQRAWRHSVHASIFPPRCSRGHVSFTVGRSGICCRAACCGRRIRDAGLIELKEDGAREIAGLVTILAMAVLPASSAKPKMTEAALKMLHKDATWTEGETLPDENNMTSFLKAQPVKMTVIDKRVASADAKVLTIRRQSTRPSSPMPRSRLPAPSRSGRRQGTRLDP